LKTIKYINLLLMLVVSLVVILEKINILKKEIHKVSLFNSDQSNFVKFCDNNNLEIVVSALLILSILSIYQIKKEIILSALFRIVSIV
jgi:hypothetical protein